MGATAEPSRQELSMRTASLRRKTLLLLLAACLALPWPAAAAPRRGTKTVASATSPLWNGAWSALQGFLQSLWGEEGCDIDPDGRCAPRAGRPTAHTGCDIDPDGRCVTRATQPKPTTDTGCDIDPNGRCHT